VIGVGVFNASEWLVDRHVAAGDGDRMAFRCEDRTLSYAGLLEATWAAANGLRALGVGSGDRVLMVISDEEAFPAVFLGALRVGAVAAPVSTMLRPADVAALAADSEASAVVVSERYAGYLEQVAAAAPGLRGCAVVDGIASRPTAGGSAGAPDGGGAHGWSSDGGGVRGWSSGAAAVRGWSAGAVAVHAWSELTSDSSEVEPAAAGGDEAGFWLYTSGTTGEPKGAIHRHRDIRAVCDTYARTVLRIGPDDVCYSVAKLFFAFGLGNALFFPLSVGASAVLDPQSPSPARTAELAARHRPTLFFAPPGFCSAMVDAGLPAGTLASARYTVTAGEALPGEVMRRFVERFGTEMLDGIGSTEALHIFCSNHPGEVRADTSGRPVEGYSIELRADDGTVINAPDTPGYLWVRGESVAAGYWRRPEVTAATFVDGWLRTGDVYTRSVDGYWRFVGRNSDMIKAGGIWVSPAEVESVLLEHDDVLEAAVVGGRDAGGLEVVVAFVVPRTGRVVDVASVGVHCRERMASFKRPRQVHVVAELPKTATGKIQRFALRDQVAGAGR
jgi:benzoate-CoA ligase family protein